MRSHRACRTWFVLSAALCASIATACRKGDQERPASGSGETTAAAPSAATPAPAPDSAAPFATAEKCPKYGLWQPCNVEDRLASSGLVFTKRPDPAPETWMQAPGLEYDFGGRAVAKIFFYKSRADQERVAATLDTAQVSPRAKRVYWKEPAQFVFTNNLAAIVITLNERLAERISDALGAGMPADPPRRSK
jgi:hypothetical protein